MSSGERLTLFLCGDVMTGRGVDQILVCPSSPSLHEPRVRSALEYVALAEQANGTIPRPVDHAYAWGAALEVLDQERPDVRIANLETSITTSNVPYPKGINYRMHPGQHTGPRGAANRLLRAGQQPRPGLGAGGIGGNIGGPGPGRYPHRRCGPGPRGRPSAGGTRDGRGEAISSSPLVPPTAGSRADAPPSPRGLACTCCRTSRNPRSNGSPGWCSQSSGPAM
jgi:Bacterial capsule synthesis protein PGA_cap